MTPWPSWRASVPASHGRWTIPRRATFASPCSHSRATPQIGYGISDSYQDRGVATEAVRALCEFAQRRTVVVLAETDRENVASQRVLEKCGFRSEDLSGGLIHWRWDIRDTDS